MLQPPSAGLRAQWVSYERQYIVFPRSPAGENWLDGLLRALGARHSDLRGAVSGQSTLLK